MHIELLYEARRTFIGEKFDIVVGLSSHKNQKKSG